MATSRDLMAPFRPNWKYCEGGRVVQQWDENGMPMFDVGANGHSRHSFKGGFGGGGRGSETSAARIARQQQAARDLGYNESEIHEMYMDGTLEDI